jgi:hypothetical protein
MGIFSSARGRKAINMSWGQRETVEREPSVRGGTLRDGMREGVVAGRLQSPRYSESNEPAEVEKSGMQ